MTHPAGLSVALSAELVEAVAQRVAELLASQVKLGRARPVGSDSPYMTIPEAAEYLRCSRQRIDNLLSQRRFSRIKEGGRTLVDRREVEDYLVKNERRRAA